MLEVENLVKVYGNFEALKGISFKIKRGEILGLIGENGAGKTTTIKILVGLITPTSGIVRYDGIDLLSHKDKIKRNMGYVPEVDSLYEDMTAEEYLRFFASLYESKYRPDLLYKLNLENKAIGEMSKGMKRKLSIARSLIHDPDYLIYDEPFSGLDPTTSFTIADFLRDLRNKAILLSAHHLYYVEYVCDRVAVMKNGEIIYQGKIDEIKGMKTYVVRLKDKTIRTNDVEELIWILKESKIVSIDVESKRLEDLYLELMR